jgi:MoaA/NifB/PqqE/SkfB family radical SAM enzyme
MQVMDNGNVLPCCPPWIDHYTIGNLKVQSAEEVWNGKKAQDFRKSILDGSFKYCNAKSCPHLVAKTGPVLKLENIRDEEVVEDIKQNKITLDHGPLEIEFTYDRSCNLSCPSCRRKVIVISGEKKKETLELQEKIKNNFFKDAKIFDITASGDAFASPVFRKLLQTLKKDDAPNLKFLRILTNGLLVKKYWDTISDYVKTIPIHISVSVDATEEETYLINRRGGTWEGIHENLKFIGELKASGEICSFQTSFVVQQNNFKEMKDFVKMSENYGANYVQFQIIEPDFIRDLHYMDYLDEWLEKAIQEKKHPEHKEFLEVLRDDFFDLYPEDSENKKESDSLVIAMGQLRNLRKGKDISQYEENLREYEEIKSKREEEKRKREEEKRIQDGLKLVKKGLLKDIWYKNEVYFINSKDLRKENGIDVVELPINETVMWHKDKKEWVKF